MNLKAFESVHFQDFATLAILFAILLGISAVEYSILKQTGKSPAAGLRLDAFKKAYTGAFLGILVSLAGGIASMASKPIANVVVLGGSVFLLLLWATYQRRASSVIDFDLLAQDLDEKYSLIILSTAKARRQDAEKEEGDEALYRESLVAAQKPDGLLKEINKVLGNQSIVLPLFAAQSTFQSFLLTRDRFDRIVTRLRNEGRLEE